MAMTGIGRSASRTAYPMSGAGGISEQLHPTPPPEYPLPGRTTSRIGHFRDGLLETTALPDRSRACSRRAVEVCGGHRFGHPACPQPPQNPPAAQAQAHAPGFRGRPPGGGSGGGSCVSRRVTVGTVRSSCGGWVRLAGPGSILDPVPFCVWMAVAGDAPRGALRDNRGYPLSSARRRARSSRPAAVASKSMA